MRGSPVHRRQFIVDRRPHPIADGWRAVDLENGYWLSAAPELRLTRLAWGGEGGAWLLGEAWPADPDGGGVALPAGCASLRGLVAATYGWAGQWTVIAGSWMLSDPSGHANLCHTANQSNSGLLVSGSLALIHALRPELPVATRRLWWGGLNWFPPPGTRLGGVDKLLPDQALDLRAARVVRIARRQPARFAGLGVDALADRLVASVGHTLAAVAAGRRVVMPLTGGLDSRLLTAIAVAHGVPVETVTLVHPGISRADRELPPQVARRLGLPHRLVAGGRYGARRAAAYARHTLYSVADGDGYYYARGMMDWLDRDAVMIRSNVSELGKQIFRHKLAPRPWEEIFRRPEAFLAAYPDFGSKLRLQVQLRRWLHWVQDGPEDLDVIDRFFLDQRQCGWMGAIEQGAQIFDGATLQVLNSAFMHDLLLAPSPEERWAGRLHDAAMARVGAGLDDVPVNPLLNRLADKLAARGLSLARRYVNETLNLPADLALAARLRAAEPIRRREPAIRPAVRPVPVGDPA